MRRSTFGRFTECLPPRSWYHGVQMIDGRVPSGRLTDVVEPWFLGAGADSDAGKEFKAWADSVSGVAFHSSVAGMARPAGPKLALISGRTADNPRLLKEVIEQGCTRACVPGCGDGREPGPGLRVRVWRARADVFLEKPGAPTVGELEEMAAYAKSKGVGVFMGYNKNVTKCAHAVCASRRAA